MKEKDAMSYHIDTITVWDAFKENSECPFCAIEKKLETDYIDSYLGDAAMLPDIRQQVNRTGFCAAHWKGLYDAQKRLPLALQLHTHLLEQNKITSAHLSSYARLCASSGNGLLGRKPAALKTALEELKKKQAEKAASCLICEKIKIHLGLYMETTVKLFKNEKEFRTLAEEGKGFCMPHLLDLLEKAYDGLNASLYTELVLLLFKKQTENLNRLSDEVEWFTKKFDYQNKDKPWGNSQDCLPRAINKIKGRTI